MYALSTEGSLPLKLVFVSHRYLDRLRRYELSKCLVQGLKTVKDGGTALTTPWPTFFPGNASVTDQYYWRGVWLIVDQHYCGARVRGWGRASNKDRDTKRLKITVGFKRQYLRNGKSYPDEWKTGLKGRLPRFHQANLRCSAIVIFEVTAVQSFGNFNPILIGFPSEFWR